MKFFLLLTLVVTTMAGDSAILKDLIRGSNTFTAGVYKEFSKSKSGSFMVAPLSVDILLALMHAGAKGKTAQEISDGLKLPADEAKIEKAFTELSSQLESTKDYDLLSANKVYLANGLKISEKFETTAVKVFHAEIQNLDFGKSDESAKTMNNWVEEKTRNKIKDLVKSDDLKGAAAVLINAMYFRGKWVKAFNSNHTKKRNFHVDTKKTASIEQMEIRDKFRVFESQYLKAKFLELPYEGDDISMTFVLPNDVAGLSNLEEHIADVFSAPSYHNGSAHVIIPKFKIETSIDLKPILKTMGIKEPFEGSADFSGILTGEGRLTISKIIQKTFIEVEEKGTTAAAATEVVAVLGPLPPEPVFEFIADRPFIYYITIKGTVAFVGRYSGP